MQEILGVETLLFMLEYTRITRQPNFYNKKLPNKNDKVKETIY